MPNPLQSLYDYLTGGPTVEMQAMQHQPYADQMQPMQPAQFQPMQPMEAPDPVMRGRRGGGGINGRVPLVQDPSTIIQLMQMLQQPKMQMDRQPLNSSLGYGPDQ